MPLSFHRGILLLCFSYCGPEQMVISSRALPAAFYTWYRGWLWHQQRRILHTKAVRFHRYAVQFPCVWDRQLCCSSGDFGMPWLCVTGFQPQSLVLWVFRMRTFDLMEQEKLASTFSWDNSWPSFLQVFSEQLVLYVLSALLS